MKLVYIYTTRKTYWVTDDGTYLASWRGYHPLRCSHGYCLYPKKLKDFRKLDSLIGVVR